MSFQKNKKNRFPLGWKIAAGLWILYAVFIITLSILPFPELDAFLRQPHSLLITDSSGEPLYTYPLENGLLRPKTVTGEQGLSTSCTNIILDIEDQRFYQHSGVDFPAVLRACRDNLRSGSIVSGASTISMQLTSMIIPRKNTFGGKILEMLDAIRLETRLTKESILNLYLTHIPFGNNLEGYEAASRFFYEKSCAELTPAETTVLAIIPRSPELYHPVHHPERIHEVITRNHLQVSSEEWDSIKAIISENSIHPKHPVEAPHFIQFIKEQITEEERIAGDPISTTIKLELQWYTEDLLAETIRNSNEYRLSNGAVLVIEDHKIRAYVGSSDFFDSEHSGQIDGVQILRQPGSTLKPFLYELALENGFNPATILPDIPMDFGSYETYTPTNYNQSFCGPVRLRIALASSLNIPAVYTLEQLGVDAFISRLKDLGFESLNGQEDQVGVGLAVGNAEVSLFELVRAFDTFRYDGALTDLKWRKNETETSSIQVMNPPCAAVIRDILSDNNARIQGFGRRSVMATDYPTFFKTGTSNQFNNIWALGGSSDLTCGIWMGNFDGTTIIGKPGSSLPAYLVTKIFEEFSLKEALPQLPPLETAEICTLSGKITTPHCTSSIMEYFPKGVPSESCNYHRNDGIHLPDEYHEWAEQYQFNQFQILPPSQPTIYSPSDGNIYYTVPNLPIENQGIPFDIRGTGELTILDNNTELVSDSLPFKQVIYLPPGLHNLNFQYPASSSQELIIEVY